MYEVIQYFVSLVLYMTLIILYLIGYPEMLLVIYKIFKNAKKEIVYSITGIFFLISLLLLGVSSALESEVPHLFILSMGLFFSSITLYSLGLALWFSFKENLEKLGISLLFSRYSLWVFVGLFLAAILTCFFLGLKILIDSLQKLF